MKFEAGNVYKHMHFIDVSLYVRKAKKYWFRRGWKLNVYWLSNSGNILSEDVVRVYSSTGWYQC